MTEYGLFWGDMEYEQGGLYDHLAYLDRWMGTPEGFQYFDSLAEAREQAKRDCVCENICIVDMSRYVVVEVVKHETNT